MSREAMKQALEALGEIEWSNDSQWQSDRAKVAITVLRQALETEPFEYWNAVEGWVKIDEMREHFDAVGCGTIYKSAGEVRSPLYTAPPKRDLTCVCGAVWEGETMVHPPRKREWVGLTDDELLDLSYLSQKIDVSNSVWFDRLGFARAIEAKLKEKNT